MDISSQIQGLSNLVQQTVNQYVVRPAGSSGSIGISGFLFDVLDREEMVFESNITDSYVEDNTAIQDHVALRPERFTLRGYVGELTTTPEQLLQAALFVGTTMQNILALVPTFTLQANQTYTSLSSLENNVAQSLQQGQNLYDLFTEGATSAEKQQNAFQFFYSMWLSRQLCTVETPYKVFQNMAIESVRAVQHGESKYISEFSVTFKMIRTTSTLVSTPNLSTAASTAAQAVTDGSSSGVSPDFTGTYLGGNWPPVPPTTTSDISAGSLGTSNWTNLAGVAIPTGTTDGVSIPVDQRLPILSQANMSAPMFTTSLGMM